MAALSKKEIGEYIQENLAHWLADQSLAKPTQVYEIELRERMVRVEEELKHQRELMKQGFDMMEKRFEAMDKRFEAMQIQMDKRFDALTKRIDRFMVWSFSVSITMTGVIIAVLKLT